MKLDIGCGINPTGDVNTDLNIGHILIGGDLSEIVINIDPRKTPNFVRCDARYLPFQNATFEKVCSHHVLEHVHNCGKMLKEMIRVSKEEVEISCPHRRSAVAKAPYHVNYFDEKWFTENLPKFGLTKINVNTRRIIDDYYHEMCLTWLLVKLHIIPKRWTLGGYHPLVLLMRKVWPNIPKKFESKLAFNIALLAVPYEIVARGFKIGNDCKKENYFNNSK
jgi:SAM-dependent methyltransferase